MHFTSTKSLTNDVSTYVEGKQQDESKCITPCQNKCLALGLLSSRTRKQMARLIVGKCKLSSLASLSRLIKHPVALDSYLTVNEQFANKQCFPPITLTVIQSG